MNAEGLVVDDVSVDVMPSAVLLDADYRLPPVAPATTGMGWIRSNVARFSEDRAHGQRRLHVEQVLAVAGFPRVSGSVTASLLTALGLPPALEDDVAIVAAAYQPHMPFSPDADAAADRLVAACGGRTQVSAARVCVLVQAHAATLALIEVLRTGLDAAPVPTTRRIDPDGREVLVDLTDAPFGLGIHACPGRQLALHLAREALR